MKVKSISKRISAVLLCLVLVTSLLSPHGALAAVRRDLVRGCGRHAREPDGATAVAEECRGVGAQATAASTGMW